MEKTYPGSSGRDVVNDVVDEPGLFRPRLRDCSAAKTSHTTTGPRPSCSSLRPPQRKANHMLHAYVHACDE